MLEIDWGKLQSCSETNFFSFKVVCLCVLISVGWWHITVYTLLKYYMDTIDAINHLVAKVKSKDTLTNLVFLSLLPDPLNWPTSLWGGRRVYKKCMLQDPPSYHHPGPRPAGICSLTRNLRSTPYQNPGGWSERYGQSGIRTKDNLLSNIQLSKLGLPSHTSPYLC